MMRPVPLAHCNLSRYGPTSGRMRALVQSLYLCCCLLCVSFHACISDNATFLVALQVLGGIVGEIAGADRSVRGASIDHWQGASPRGRFGQRAQFEAQHTSTFF